MAPIHPELLNGDLPLTRDETAAYMDFHARRNARNAERSRALGVQTSPSPVWGWRTDSGASPARILLDAFFRRLAHDLAPRFAGRRVTIVDIGCGSGGRIATFGDAGFTGEFVGIDIVRSLRWPVQPVGGLRPSLVVGDVHALDVRRLPPIDLLISTTSLEHIRDVPGVIGRLRRRMTPGSVQVHFVPGEAALELYGKHGWRQYSPACLRGLFPRGVIYRFGGPFSSELHLRAIYQPSLRGRPLWCHSMPRMYALLRSAALGADRLLGCPRPSMYAVVQEEPDGGDLAGEPGIMHEAGELRRAG